ncbi:MAG: prolyl oligopeptidase family serine peptidase [Candidatus Kryptonium sp.]|nr:prolyl oligopeptidase family serine peptidase [Candidatus Kryptonium sp.]
MRKNFILILSILLSISISLSQKLNYPQTKTVDVVENYHGVKVADPYRWLEDFNSDEVKRWVDAQNKLTFEYIRSVAFYDKIKKRLTELMNYPRFSVPTKVENRYFFFKNDGLQNQSVLYMREGLKGKDKLVIDPNKFSEDGTIALMNLSYSRDGRFLAYGISVSGSDWQEIRIRDIATGKDFDEVLKWCKFSSIAWLPDNSGFYYNRFPEPGTVPKEDENNYNRVYFHKLGTPQSEDKLVYERPDAKELNFYPSITEDGKYLILTVTHGTSPKNRIYYRELNSTGDFVRLLDEADASYDFIGNNGSIFYFVTDLNAPRYKIIAIDVKKPDRRNWKDVIPEHKKAVISDARIINNHFVVVYNEDVKHRIEIYSLDGKFIKEIKLPGSGTVSGLSGRQKDKEMFFGFTSFLYPLNVYRYDFRTGKLELFFETKLTGFNPNDYEVKQIFYESKDGARVPMYIVHKRGLKLDGNNPALLYGYGGFNISIMPSFSAVRLLWLEIGGVYAVANLRGGSEYGEEWHQAGMLDKKQNVFNDFISAGEWLIKNGYTNSKKLVINGRSNGGLLVAACMVQRPDLYGAVVCEVPVIDMLRYHKFTVGRYWIPEYGNAEANPEHFRFLYAYSPLHNVKKGTIYPPTLITTADHDDRVVPSHAYKFTATLQSANGGDTPILLRVETKAGHGAGKPTTKVIEEQTDIYAFLFKVLGINY